MNRKIMTGALASAALLATAAPVAAATASANPPTLADVLLSDGDQFDSNRRDYDIVTEAVLLFPDLVAAASDPQAQLTAFLPNDQAFRLLVADLTGTSPRSEQAVFDAVASLGIGTVRTVLEYHLVAGPPISYSAAQQADGATLTTLQGLTLEVDVRGHGGKRVTLADEDPDARDARVVDPEIAGAAANGYAHGIDRVLRPLDL